MNIKISSKMNCLGVKHGGLSHGLNAQKCAEKPEKKSRRQRKTPPTTGKVNAHRRERLKASGAKKTDALTHSQTAERRFLFWQLRQRIAVCIKLRAKKSPRRKGAKNMAFTRKLLKTLGLTEEQVDSVIEAHTETVDGLKAQMETYKADAGKLEGVQKELDALKAANDGNDYKAMYTIEHEAFEKYKADQTAKESAALTERLYREQLTGLGIVGKRADSIVRLADLSQIKVKDGKLEDVEGVQKGIRDDYGDFIPKSNTQGAIVDNPPQGKEQGGTSRAAQIAANYYASKYGAEKEEK